MENLVRLGIFSPPVLVGVAAASGALAAAGIRVEEIAATSSSQQFAALADGELDAVLTSPDNVLAYRASADNPLGRELDVRILAAIDRGLGLSLFAAPGLDPDTQLRGGILGVDVPSSGFAFVGFELLARRALSAPDGYAVRALGSTPRRAAALIAGECTMTVLNAGSDLRAEAAGCTRVARASSLGPYLGTVLATTGDRIDRPSLRALTGVVVATAQAIVDGQLADLATAVTAQRLGLDLDGVRRHLATLRDPVEGLVRDGRLDAASLETLCRLRVRHGGGGADLAAVIEPGSGLVDDRYLTAGAHWQSP